MSLKSRLGQLQSQAGVAAPTGTAPTGKHATSPAGPSLSSLRSRIARLESRSRTHSEQRAAVCSSEALAERLGGEVVAEGLVCMRQRQPLNGRLGRFALDGLSARPALPGDLHSARRNVYLDTETTGLSGGSGTLAFLVGIAVVDDEAIDLTQWLITRFGAETALLQAFGGALRSDDRLVSYNGKCFDLPLLTTRFRMQGVAAEVLELPHLDLLHPVRRLFGRRWPDCRLQTLEQRLLGLQRLDDLPGSEAPAAWFDWLRRAQPDMLTRVVEHHRQDIISLPVAHAALAQAAAQPDSQGVDIHALACWLCDTDESSARAMLLEHSDALCDNGRRLLARLQRRAGQLSAAVALWETLAAAGCSESLEHLAKYHEHVSKDLRTARSYCAQLPPGEARTRRCRRLDRKLAGQPVRARYHAAESPR